MVRHAVGLLVLLCACGASSGSGVETTDDSLWARDNVRWSASGDGITRISVCWETPGFPAQKETVRRAIHDSWSAVASIQFVGWGDCGNGDIRVRIADERPRVPTFGAALRSRPGGVTLNFTYAAFAPSCASHPTTCNVGYAIHEFGHALGFLHEQDRPDAPPTCPDGNDQRTGTNASNAVALGPYDPSSIMNYCDPTFFSAPALSPGDIAGVQAQYGSPGAPTPGTAGYQGVLVGLAGKCLDDWTASTDDGTPIILWPCHGQTSQHWTYADGEIRGPGGKCLDVTNGDDTDGTPIQLYTCNGTPAQRWTWQPDGTVRGLGGKCLDVAGAGTEDGTPIQLYPCNGTVAQNWSPSW